MGKQHYQYNLPGTYQWLFGTWTETMMILSDHMQSKLWHMTSGIAIFVPFYFLNNSLQEESKEALVPKSFGNDHLTYVDTFQKSGIAPKS